MARIAKWNNKVWEVSPRKVMDLSGLSFGYELNAEDNEHVEGSPQNNKRGLKKQVLSFSTNLNAALGVDVRREIESWKELIGQSAPFYLGGKQLGPNFLLTAAKPSAVRVDDKGRMRSAVLTFTFEEDDEPSTADAPSALSITATEADKAIKKPVNSAISAAKPVSFAKGETVRVVGTNYATGQKVPVSVMQRNHVIYQVNTAQQKALLGHPAGINSWVPLRSLTLV